MNRRHFLAASALGGLALAVRGADVAPRLRVAVIGHTGRGNYGHGVDTMWLTVPEVEIVAVADADAKGLAEAQKKLKLTRGFADYRQMLTETKPDIVAIGPRYIDEHRDMILAACASGARGIYMEKPFCRTLGEADEIAATCEQHQVRLALAHRNRYHPVLQTIDQLIKDGTLGRVLELRGRGKEDQRGGALDLWVLGSHVINLACYFGGRPLACTATLLQDRRPVVHSDVQDGAEGVGPLAGNEVHARFETERGFPFFFDSIQSAGVPAAGFGLQIIGTKGTIDLRVDAEPLAHWLPGNPFQPVKEPRTWHPITTGGIDQPELIANLGRLGSGHQLGARDLIAAIREKREPVCNVREARTTVECIMAVFESHRLNGQRVPFPLTTRVNPLAQL